MDKRNITSEDRVLTAYGVAQRLAYDRAKARAARRYLRARGRELDPARALEIDMAGSGAKADADFWAQVWSAWAYDEIRAASGEQAAKRAFSGGPRNWRTVGMDLGLGMVDADIWLRGRDRGDAAGWIAEAADRVRSAIRSERGWYRGLQIDAARMALKRAREAQKEN